MIFDAHHYVPVLKVKRGEKKALELLSSAVRAKVTPLLEIVERTADKTLEEHLRTAFSGLATAVQAFDRCFIDTREIASDGAAVVFKLAVDSGIIFTPVTGINRSADNTAAALKFGLQGVALRLDRGDFEAGRLTASVLKFLSQHHLVPEKVDLIIDLGAVDKLVSYGVERLAISFLKEVPDHKRWRTFTLSANAFPSSMGVVERDSHIFIERADWIAWRDGLYRQRTKLARLPTYSDGGIQNPKGVEGFNPQIMQVSASIRYATNDSWLLIKGESTRRTVPSEQFPLLAQKIVNNPLRKHYYGTHHCKGCACIEACAKGSGGYGSAEAWRRLGTIHHITTVVQELDALSWP
jgi:hypothetical protein